MTAYKKIPVRTFFLEKKAPFECNNTHENRGFAIREIKDITSNAYLKIYKSVGGEYGWTSRLMLAEKELQNILNRKESRLYFLEKNKDFAGFFEAEVCETKAELLYFGLDEKYLGQGLGKSLMQSVFCAADQWGIESLSLHTCEYDHAAALPFYKTMGFKLIGEKILNEYYPTDFPKNKTG